MHLLPSVISNIWVDLDLFLTHNQIQKNGKYHKIFSKYQLGISEMSEMLTLFDGKLFVSCVGQV